MQKTTGQKFTYAFSILSFLASVGCLAGIFIYEPTKPMDPITASLMASCIFFISVGVVLYVIATARLKGLLSAKD